MQIFWRWIHCWAWWAPFVVVDHCLEAVGKVLDLASNVRSVDGSGTLPKDATIATIRSTIARHKEFEHLLRPLVSMVLLQLSRIWEVTSSPMHLYLVRIGSLTFLFNLMVFVGPMLGQSFIMVLAHRSASANITRSIGLNQFDGTAQLGLRQFSAYTRLIGLGSLNG